MVLDQWLEGTGRVITLIAVRCNVAVVRCNLKHARGPRSIPLRRKAVGTERETGADGGRPSVVEERSERRAERGEGRAQLVRDGLGRDAHDLRDLAVGQLVDAAQDEDLAAAGGERFDGAVEGVSQLFG